MRLGGKTIRLRAILALAVAGLLATQLFFYVFPRPARWLEPDDALLLPEAGRVVVIAPHNDDEVLAAGGFIQLALRRGLDVRVVFLTNGDGFPVAAAREAGRLLPSPADFEQLGQRRQQESLAALAVLGVPAAHASFLGFPDGGLADLWQHYWAPGRPYRSRHTLRTAAGAGGGSAGTLDEVPYAGDAVVTELGLLLREWQPQLVVLPHPADAHKDHWATYNFSVYTLEWLRQSGEAWVNDLEAWHYVVHRGDWPAPKGLRPAARLAPPPGLLAGSQHWQALPVPAELVQRKISAIRAYGSQVRVMRRYLLSFARSNELFARLPPIVVPPLPAPAGSAPEVAALTVAMRQTFQDTIARRLEPAADVTELRAGLAADGLWLYAGASGSRGIGIRYRLMLRSVSAGLDGEGLAWWLEWTRQGEPRLTMLGGPAPELALPPTATWTGRGWLIFIPAPLLGEADAVMPGIQTFGPGGGRISQTGWPLLLLSPR